ncbi:MAG: amidase [Streptosporangiales bacterium]|nr:amidase [Streptosporangiales bacterium]
MSEIHDLTALEQAAAVRARTLSPVELVEHYLARIERVDPQLGAYVTVTADLAREEARRAEKAVADARNPDDLPPLHGVPVPIKDLTMVAGVRTTFGSAAYVDFVPPVDDGVVAFIRDAGAIVLGKTNTPEFGLPCYTESAIAPPARTPWDLRYSAGGSSGGAAAAVAAGLAPLAHGNDGGGSIRIPASVCGLFGIKPARGRVSFGPFIPDFGLASHGPIARTVRDAALLLDVMAHALPGDPYWAPPPPDGGTFLAQADRYPGRLRIGRYATPPVPDAQVHPECLAAYESASRLLAELGHEVEDIQPPFTPELVESFVVMWGVMATRYPVDESRADALLPLTRWLRAKGEATPATAYAAAVGELQLATRRAVGAVQPYDAVLTPTLASPPALVGEFHNEADPAHNFAKQKNFTPFTAVYNVTGQPAVTVPLHWTADDLPVGVMLVGRPADEATLIALAAALEEARPWRDRHPSLW